MAGICWNAGWMTGGWWMDTEAVKQTNPGNEWNTQSKLWNLTIAQSYPQDHARPSLTCLPLRIQLLNMAMGGKWMFIPLRKIWYNWLWNGLSHPHVKWNLHDIPMTNPPPVKFTIAYRDSKSRPLCAIKKLKLKDANAKTPDANAANLWFGQGPHGR